MGHWIDGMYYLDHEVKTGEDGTVKPKKVKGFGMAGDAPAAVPPGSPVDMVTQGPAATVEPPATYQTKIVSPAVATKPEIQTKETAGDDSDPADDKPASTPAKK